MGHNASGNPFKQARETSPARFTDDSYVAPSRWRSFRKLDALVRTRYFGPDELAWLSRYGARLDRLATLNVDPRNDREKHFVRVCLGHEQPTNARERLWLLMQVVCRYEEAAARAARTDVLEEEAVALRAFARAAKAKTDHLEAFVLRLSSELRHASEPPPSTQAPVCNVVWASARFRLVGGGGRDATPTFQARSCS